MTAFKHVCSPGFETNDFWLGWKPWNCQKLAPRGTRKTHLFCILASAAPPIEMSMIVSPLVWDQASLFTWPIRPFPSPMCQWQKVSIFRSDVGLEHCQLGSITAEPLMGKVKQTAQKSSTIDNRSFQQIKFQNWVIWSLDLVGFVCALAIFLVWSWVHSAHQISTISSLIQIPRWYFDHECFY